MYELILTCGTLVWFEKFYSYCNEFLQWKEIDLCIDVYHNHHEGITCLSNLLLLEQCNVMYKVISDIMVYCYYLWNAIVLAINFCHAKKMICALMFIISNHYGIQYNVMFKVISDIMAHWFEMWNTIVISISFCTRKTMICALMFIIME